MTLGEQIRAAREEKNLSQEELAEALGVSRQAVSKWENNTAVPQGANRNALVQVLGLDILKEETPAKKAGVFPWIGWVLAAVLLLALAGVLVYQKLAPDDSTGEPSTGTVNVPPAEDPNMEPALHRIRFYDETQEQVVCGWPDTMYPVSYNIAQIDSILLQWTGDIPLETVKMFYAPFDGKTELAGEFKGPSDGSHALLLPADALHRESQANLYFELHFAGNRTITTETFRIYFDDGISILAFIDDFDGKLLTYDKVEWVDTINSQDRAEELGITEEDAPNGFYIYNEQDAAARRLVANDCVYTVLNWSENFTPMAVSAAEFRVLLNERAVPGTPYELTLKENQIVEIRECYVP